MASTRSTKAWAVPIFSRTRSVASLVAFVLAAITTLLMGVFLAYSYGAERGQQWEGLQRNLELTSDQAAAALVLPVWNVDGDQIEKVIESVLKDKDIYGVVLRRTGQAFPGVPVFYARKRDDQWRVVAADGEIPAGDLLMEQRPVVKVSDVAGGASETIGTLKIYETPKFTELQVRGNFLRLALFMVGLDLALILSLYSLLWLIVLRPLRAIEQYALAVNSGDTTGAVSGRFRGELESVRLSIENMVALLASRYASLHESESRLRAVFESSRDAIGVAKGGVHIFANPAYLKLFGFTSNAEIAGSSIVNSIASSHRQLMLENTARRSAGEKIPAFYETRGVRTDGTEFDMEINVATYELNGELYSLATIRDITERKRAEEALKESESRFRTLIEKAPVAMAITRGGNYLYRNPANLRMFGVPVSEAHTISPVLDRIAPSKRDMVRENIARRAAGLPVQTPYESRGLRTDGTEFPFEYDVTQAEFGDGPVNISFITDLTERKRAEALMIESEKLRTVAGLAAGVAHEINNPVAAMVQNAQVALNRLNEDRPANLAIAAKHGVAFDAMRRYMADREIPETLEAIRSSGRQVSRIVQNLLAYSRRETAKSTVNLARLVDQTLELAANDYELKKRDEIGSVEIERAYAAEEVVAVAHANQIQQVLLNLIRNAVQAMRANPADRKPRLRVGTFTENGYGCISVEDNGPGVPAEIRGKMFEPFVTTKAEGEGTGLGLFVCYHIVTVNHAGRIHCEPAAGQGTRCTIELPASKSATTA